MYIFCTFAFQPICVFEPKVYLLQTAYTWTIALLLLDQHILLFIQQVSAFQLESLIHLHLMQLLTRYDLLTPFCCFFLISYVFLFLYCLILC